MAARRRPGRREILWFLGLWAAGVGTVAVAGLLIRAMLAG